MPLFISLILTLSLAVATISSPEAMGKSKPTSSWKVTAARLKKNGFSNKFIMELKRVYVTKKFHEVLELNTLLFLKKSDYHGIQINDEAAQTVTKFMIENQVAIDSAQSRYKVPGEIIASLLWIESRHGQNLGRFHVPSVFLTLLQANRPPIVQHLYKAGKRFTAKITRQDRKDILSRANKRTEWAVSELRAIEKMQNADPTVLKNLKGSFAGAFGMAQFIPSSYVAYSRSESLKKPADLTQAADAIHSVAYYLHASGWKTSKESTHVKALMLYNNSRDYVDAILKLARQSEGDRERNPAQNYGNREHSKIPN